MIFYFSGTGNSAWIAARIGKRTGDGLYEICGKNEMPSADIIMREKSLGFVFPVYAWGAPEAVLDYAGKLYREMKERGWSGFSWGVCTCGGDAGYTMKKFAEVFPLDSSYSIIMPNNYVSGSEVDTGAVAAEKIKNGGDEADCIAEKIAEGKTDYRVKEGAVPALKSGFVNMGFNRFARGTGGFSADSRCTGCGLCAENCPAGVISMKDGKPEWKGNCYQCLKCINRCPAEAIQKGKSTVKRNRYYIEKYI